MKKLPTLIYRCRLCNVAIWQNTKVIANTISSLMHFMLLFCGILIGIYEYPFAIYATFLFKTTIKIKKYLKLEKVAIYIAVKKHWSRLFRQFSA